MKKALVMLIVVMLLLTVGCAKPETQELTQTSDVIITESETSSVISEDSVSTPSKIQIQTDESSKTNSTDNSSTVPTLKKGRLNFAPIKYLSLKHKTSNQIVGVPYRYIKGVSSILDSKGIKPPWFEFICSYINVVAKAVKEYNGVYKSFNSNGTSKLREYRLFKMEVLDPLQSDMEGEFYYLLPNSLSGDLTKYDALLLSMAQRTKNSVLECNGKLTAYEYIFEDYIGSPDLGGIIPFTNGVFDESLWKEKSWEYGYQSGKVALDKEYESLIVRRGSTLEEALIRRIERLERVDDWENQILKVNHNKYKSEMANATIEYIAPFKNGVFSSATRFDNSAIYRFINGCPTNEEIIINPKTEKVTASKYKFEDKDFEGLPNISQYIADIDISKMDPIHINTKGKLLIYKSAMGWYEKTKDGIYSIVRISWRYREEKDAHTEYYDEVFIILDKKGDRYISREDLIKLIGENKNIYTKQYGEKIPMPIF